MYQNSAVVTSGFWMTRGAVVSVFRLNLKKEDQDRKVLVIYMRGPPEWEATVRAGSSRMGHEPCTRMGGLKALHPNGGARTLHLTLF